jgi:hypothetical protein
MEMCGMFVDRAAQKEMSIVAIDTETGNIEGCIINEDWKEGVPEGYRQLPVVWVGILTLFVFPSSLIPSLLLHFTSLFFCLFTSCFLFFLYFIFLTCL